MSNLNRKIRNMEDEMEQLTTKLRTTNDKLEDIAKAADECERLTKIGCINVVDCRWHHGAVDRVLDLRSIGRGFKSRPGTRCKISGQVSYTCVPL